ncbi:sugar ABC transporter substrate-binding protein [Actinomyces sp. MRS3W]|uniref:sugar ABC transporter substrate-binding protein n=1 Tax=Actinomyces sp. MRS3W TaxID=2800796 RepID=UPI0028FDC012|nr:sugar ABC transporter substrate-binding protein [Actinomyces sp. MRS3W]MDU0349808.1 sugar ABC transporter substrate-binding protein [Actinomyces sp. MRS3W]
MKRVLTTLGALILAAAMVSACAPRVPAGTTRIALVMSHMTNSFTTTVAGAAVAEGKELGVQVTVFDGNSDAATQISQIESAVAQGYDGILVEPVSKEGIAPGLKAANEAEIPIATMVQQAEQQDRAASYIGGDDTAAGTLQMEKVIEAIGEDGTVAILYGPMGSDGQLQRKAGYDAVLAQHPGVSVVLEQTANWDTAEALTVTENWLSTGTHIDAIVAQNDSMALGALKALTNAGRAEEVHVSGVDATDDGVASIRNGGMAGTVSQDTAGIGRLAVQTMDKLIKGEEVEAVNFTEAVWITADNVDSLDSPEAEPSASASPEE